MKISNKTTVVVADDIISCELDGEAAILTMNDGIYYGLNPIGAKIWNLIQKPIKINEIISVIMKEYNVETERCQIDIQTLINDLLNHGLVKVNADT
ncbi:MAG: PqqD family protein [Methanobacterium sp.]|nr:PqqD family protein [Methanobacterium sp.]